MALCLLCPPVGLFACDLCGSAGGSASPGLLPLVQRHYVGMRWQLQDYYTDAHGSDPNSIENFYTFEVWGRWQPHRRLQFVAALPYQYNTRHFDNGRSLRVGGMGDISVVAQFALLDPARQAVRMWQHTIQAGAGIKLATGAFCSTFDATEGAALPAFQPGTGSTDGLFTGLYAIRRGKWGASIDAAWRYMGQSTNGYQFGNRINASCRLFRNEKLWGIALLPYMGTSLDTRQKDKDGSENLWDTGGKALLGFVGTEAYWKNFAFNAGLQHTVVSDLSNGYVRARNRVNVSLVWLFGGKTNPVLNQAAGVFKNIKKPDR